MHVKFFTMLLVGHVIFFCQIKVPLPTKWNRLKVKRHYIRFLPPNELSDCQRISEDVAQQLFCAQQQINLHMKKLEAKSANGVGMYQSSNMTTALTSTFPKYISVADLLKAGKLIKPTKRAVTTLHLETFDLNKQCWVSKAVVGFAIEETTFACGGFRNAHKV